MSEKPLTERQQKAISFVRDYGKQHGRSPSIREVGIHLGLTHPNHAKPILDQLRDLGYLVAGDVGGRAGRPRLGLQVASPDHLTLPMRGRVSCGKPTPRDEDTEDRLDLRAMFNRDDLVVFRAVGKSMIEAAISPGDYLIVRECPEPETGQTVVAVVKEQMLCKRLRRRRGKVRLEACNAQMEPLDLDPADVTFLGVLHTVLRKV